MKMPKKIDDLLGEKLDSKIGYSWLVYQQVNRINQALTFGEIPSFISGVESLEVMFYQMIVKDPKIATISDKGKIKHTTYLKYLTDLEEEFTKKLEDLKKGRYIPHEAGDKTMALAYLRAKEKFRMLMLLMDELGLLPAKTTTYREKGTGEGTESTFSE
jgi:hypothetical protein